MIEREVIAQKTKEYYIKQYVKSRLSKVGGISSIRLKKIPLGEKIIIHSSKPSLIVGSKGSNIKELTKELKREFNLENPQIEINEVREVYLDANIVAEKIISALERFGSARFKSIGHKIMENVMKSGALGIEIIISGKIPSARAKNWRFYQGYLKKCGEIAISGVRKAQAQALLKSGVVGVKVVIMPPDVTFPDHIKLLTESQSQQIIEEITKSESKAEDKKLAKRTSPAAKKSRKKGEDDSKTSRRSTKKSEEKAPKIKEESAPPIKEQLEGKNEP